MLRYSKGIFPARSFMDRYGKLQPDKTARKRPTCQDVYPQDVARAPQDVAEGQNTLKTKITSQCFMRFEGFLKGKEGIGKEEELYYFRLSFSLFIFLNNKIDVVIIRIKTNPNA